MQKNRKILHRSNYLIYLVMSKIDYKLKGILLNTDLPNITNKIQRAFYRYQYNLSTIDISTITSMFDAYFGDNYKIYYECIKINNARYKRSKRLRAYINSMLMIGQCYFLTLTFTDNILNTTTEQYRRTFITRWLKANYPIYVANIDYGNDYDYIDDSGKIRKGTQREHYHAVVLVKDKVDYTSYKIKKESCRINAKPIKVNENTDSKIGEYISKLTNHAIKHSNKRQCVIYSRSTKK